MELFQKEEFDPLAQKACYNAEALFDYKEDFVPNFLD